MLIPTVIGTSALILALTIFKLPTTFISTADDGFSSAKLMCFKAAA